MTYKARTVLHGVDQSCESFAKLPDPSNMAALCLQEDTLQRWVYDATQGAWLPVEYFAFDYDVDVDGGTVGDHSLGEKMPSNMIVLDGVIDVLDPLVSGGAAKLELTLQTAGDVQAATVTTSCGTEGLHDVVPNGQATNMIKTTAERTPKATVSVAPLTAGHLRVFLRCIRTAATEEQSSSSQSSSSSSASSSNSSSASSSTSSTSSASSSTSSTSSTSSASSSTSSTSSTSSQSSSESSST